MDSSPDTQPTRPNHAKAVSVFDLHFEYASGEAVAVAHFELMNGKSCALMGPSGCGKSTFVHLLAGLLTPQRGSISILGENITALSESQRDRFRGKHIGFIFQRFHLIPSLSVRENLRLSQKLARAGADLERIDTVLRRLGLAALGDRKPDTLSHGQAQRVAIARALAHGPSLVIADEPTSALDDDRARQVLQLLQDTAAESGAALLVVTHDQRIRGALDSEFSMGTSQ